MALMTGYAPPRTGAAPQQPNRYMTALGTSPTRPPTTTTAGGTFGTATAPPQAAPAATGGPTTGYGAQYPAHVATYNAYG